ncbi:hypothetical protein GLOTRDRAFT_130754 [Gloeophyllum trabeum ATCC 11539]|uniref:Retroviral polymerase SH3-like domain-containing protein n=1 Tax=Gloeophyllum trabeum (strain ATCC 11539 / FP-39264 / Madison 617) TaxID=670483 RepID=S7RGS2_GLOTA|nr:uncharacterized protein GLOTRDRAFT_130754 [Gloeophyllum trabeum ATCC 11539]EPQ53415.1 hypothetical protein GLOTRDRAFT_130754 [Gloeophyllum trabeum ATCC 11539]
MDKAQSMRLESCSPPSWWEFAVDHAVHVYNRTPLKHHQWQTPYEVLNKEAPDIKHLRVFGCGAYVYLPKETRPNKLSPKAELMTYIGVADGSHGFKFMRTNNSVVTQPTALLDEAMFPKCSNTKRRASTRLQSAPKPENSDDDWITDDDEPDSRPPPNSQKG